MFKSFMRFEFEDFGFLFLTILVQFTPYTYHIFTYKIISLNVFLQEIFFTGNFLYIFYLIWGMG